MDGFIPKVGSGQNVTGIRPQTWNKIADSINGDRIAQTNDRPVGQVPSSSVVRVKNTTGVTLERHTAHSIGPSSWTLDNTSWLETQVFNLVAWDRRQPPAIIQQPLAADEVGWAIVSGVSLCQVNNPHSTGAVRYSRGAPIDSTGVVHVGMGSAVTFLDEVPLTPSVPGVALVSLGPHHGESCSWVWARYQNALALPKFSAVGLQLLRLPDHVSQPDTGEQGYYAFWKGTSPTSQALNGVLLDGAPATSGAWCRVAIAGWTFARVKCEDGSGKISRVINSTENAFVENGNATIYFESLASAASGTKIKQINLSPLTNQAGNIANQTIRVKTPGGGIPAATTSGSTVTCGSATCFGVNGSGASLTINSTATVLVYNDRDTNISAGLIIHADLINGEWYANEPNGGLAP